MDSTIAKAEFWRCPLPMPRELHLGAITYTTRDYVVLRLTTDDGLTGSAIGYTRNTPVFDALHELLPHLLGTEFTEPTDITNMLKRRFAPGWGSMVRAASLIDIALWDIRAKESNVPVSRLFGSIQRDVPLMVVAGYFLDQRGTAAVVDEVRQFVDEGYATIKLIVPGHDLPADLSFVSEVAAVLPTTVQLAIDFHGAFSDVGTASSYCRAFNDYGLRFIEDPFVSYETDSVLDVVSAVDTAIASGEDLITPSSYRQLIAGGVRYLRTDATATGGYSATLEGIAVADAHQAIVAPHVWPHIHMPLTARSPAISMIEVIPHYSGADPIDLILSEPFPIRDGRWRAPEQSGLYLPLDWDRVTATSSASQTVR